MDTIKEAILQTLITIPKGEICSYGQLAKLAGYPGYARYVGHVLKTLPDDSTLPWHRIINSKNEISFPKGSPKHLEQRARLEKEGLTFNGNKCSPKHRNKKTK